MIQISALWKKESKQGKTYYSGKLGQGKLLLYKNDFKRESKHPDLILYLAEDEKKEDREKEESRSEPEHEDDVPF